MDPDASPRVRLTADDPRPGSRPATSTEGPHRQLDQRSSPELWGRLVAAVFALDGVLLGAGDTAYLRTTTLACALGAFLPLIWLSWAYDWGLAGIWVGLTMFVVTRMLAVVWRTRSGIWAVAGA